MDWERHKPINASLMGMRLRNGKRAGQSEREKVLGLGAAKFLKHMGAIDSQAETRELSGDTVPIYCSGLRAKRIDA